MQEIPGQGGRRAQDRDTGNPRTGTGEPRQGCRRARTGIQESPAASPGCPGRALSLLSQILVLCVHPGTIEYPELEGGHGDHGGSSWPLSGRVGIVPLRNCCLTREGDRAWSPCVTCPAVTSCLSPPLTGRALRVHPVCLLQHQLSQLLVERGQVPGPCRAHAGEDGPFVTCWCHLASADALEWLPGTEARQD
ncbi:hypothetical protein Nmel_016027 [Mimus melanotis]